MALLHRTNPIQIGLTKLLFEFCIHWRERCNKFRLVYFHDLHAFGFELGQPGLGLAIKADMAGQKTTAVAWPSLMPLVADFWHIVCTRLDSKARAGRLKQWLNFLRRRFPEAEVAYQALKRINDPAVIDDWLVKELSQVVPGQLPSKAPSIIF